MKHGHGLLCCRICCGSVRSVLRVCVRVEQVIVIVALLNHPNDDEDNDVQEVFLDEEAADWGTDTGPVQASVAVDGGVDGDNYVEGKGHGEHEIRLGLDLGELGRLCI